MKQETLSCSSHILTKVNSRWVTDLKVKETTLKSLEKTGGKFSDPGIQPLDLAPKLKEFKKKKKDELNLTKNYIQNCF